MLFQRLSDLMVVFSLTLISTLSAETVVAGISDWGPWNQIAQNGKQHTGILTEIFTEAIKRTGHQTKIIECPHQRRNRCDWGNKVQAELGVAPEWRTEFKQVSAYTVPVYQTVDVVVVKKGKLSKKESVLDFKSMTIGTNQDYRYTDGFDEAFNSGIIVRDDTPVSGSSNFDKLVVGRFDCAIMDRYEARYWIKMKGLKQEDFEEIYVFKTPSNLCFRLHISKSHLIEPLNRAIAEMKQDGTIEKIVSRYTK